ncbi:MAG: hypothetical protein ACRDY3_03535 [Acidimicrobiales bacterium]
MKGELIEHRTKTDQSRRVILDAGTVGPLRERRARAEHNAADLVRRSDRET